MDKSLYLLLTTVERIPTRVFLCSGGFYKLAKRLTSDRELYVKILRDRIGASHVLRMFGISEDIDMILFNPIMGRFTDIIIDGPRGCELALRILKSCINQQKKRTFCHVMVRDACDEKGYNTLKQAITLAENRFKDIFLDVIAQRAFYIRMDVLGISVIQHVLKLEFTRKTTEGTRFHGLMSEFDEILVPTILWTSDDMTKLHKLALKLTSDCDRFVDFIKSRRGSLMAMIFLGKSEEVDMMVFEAIKKRFTDVTTDKFSYPIVVRIVELFKMRENFEVHRQVQHLIGVHALYLTKNPYANGVVQDVIDHKNFGDTIFIANQFRGHYIELSFHEYGSKVVEKLVDKCRSLWALGLAVKEIIACDEDTLIRLAKDKHGNKVLKMTLEVARRRRVDYGNLVEKMKPILDRLRGSQAENIAAIVDSAIVTTIEVPIVSDHIYFESWFLSSS